MVHEKLTLGRSDFCLSSPSDVKKESTPAVIFKKLISKKPGQNSQNLGLNANIATTLPGCIRFARKPILGLFIRARVRVRVRAAH